MCAMMQKLRVSSTAIEAALCGEACRGSIVVTSADSSDLSHSIHSIKIDNMPRLIINGTVHELVEELITIGRGPDNTIVISDSSVSSHHAQLQRVGETEARYEADAIGSQPPPQIQEVEARPAKLSAVLAGFANASPFLHQKDQQDTVRSAILAGLAVILLIFLGSMIAVLLMHAPAP